jgi:hypothetical protein
MNPINTLKALPSRCPKNSCNSEALCNFPRRGTGNARTIPKLQDYRLSAVRNGLRNIFVTTSHIWKSSYPSTKWGRFMRLQKDTI